MNQAIADIIKGHIEDLDFIDKIAGLVATATIEILDENKTPVRKSFPIACCVTAEDCKQGAYNDLAPDSRYRSVLYFEDMGVQFLRTEGNFKHYRSNLRLVCWLNIKKILGVNCDASICTYAAHAIADIIRHLPAFPEHHDPFDRVYSEVVNQEIRSTSFFAKYTYNELQVQYLMSPYDYFALDIQTIFSICLAEDTVFTPCEK